MKMTSACQGYASLTPLHRLAHLQFLILGGKSRLEQYWKNKGKKHDGGAKLPERMIKVKANGVSIALAGDQLTGKNVRITARAGDGLHGRRSSTRIIVPGDQLVQYNMIPYFI